jgi:uncharacterized membrane protein YqhA
VEERPSPAPFAGVVSSTRYVVLLAVAAVLLVSASLFVLAALQSGAAVVSAVQGVVRGESDSAELTVKFLEIVSSMLKAVVFYLVGVGLYSLFIAPLNLPAALGVESFSDLETRIVSVVIVIMAVTFLEHFVAWKDPEELVRFGGTMAAVVLALVAFQYHNTRARQEQKRSDAATEVRAQRHLFQEGEQRRRVVPEDAATADDEEALRSAGE